MRSLNAREQRDLLVLAQDAVRSHTRAIWALKGEVDYSPETRKAIGKNLSERLQRFNAMLESPNVDKRARDAQPPNA